MLDTVKDVFGSLVGSVSGSDVCDEGPTIGATRG